MKVDNEVAAPIRSAKLRSWGQIICEDLPFVNLIYDMLFDVLPSPDGVKDTLNLIGLIDALVVGLALAILTSCSFDENISTDQRFVSSEDESLSGYHSLYNSGTTNIIHKNGATVSAKYAYNSFMGVIFLFVSLLCVLATYLDFSNKNFSAKYSKGDGELKFAAWWWYARFAVFLSFATLVAGIIFSSGSLAYVVLMKFPDYHVSRHGTLAYSYYYPYGCYLLSSSALLGIILISIVLLGLGTKESFKLQRELDKEEEEEVSKGVYAIERDKWKTLLEKKTQLPEKEINNLLDALQYTRVCYQDRFQLSKEDLKELGLFRLGHALQVLRAIGEKKDADDSKQE